MGCAGSFVISSTVNNGAVWRERQGTYGAGEYHCRAGYEVTMLEQELDAGCGMVISLQNGLVVLSRASNEQHEGSRNAVCKYPRVDKHSRHSQK